MNTNYDFNFNGKNIDIVEDGYEINPTTGNAIPREIKIGSYDLFQSITIKNTDDNTENIKFITTNIGGKQKAILPIFYLKYIDDKKATENLVTAIELTFDLALTATGIGNLAKLRHLKHLTSLGRVALGLEAAVPGQILISYELAQGVAGLIEVSSSIASILLSYGNTYRDTYCNPESQSYDPEKCTFYSRLDVIVTVMQVFSGVLDFATSRQLKNASRKILDGPIPDGFDPDALIILRKFAGDIDEIKEVFRARLFEKYGNNNSSIWQKLNDLPTSPANKQEMFILDFERATDDVLNSLNANNGELIHYWDDIEHFPGKRREIGFLKDLKKIKNSTELNDEIFKGKIRPKLKNMYAHLPPPHPDNHYEWIGKGVHHNEAFLQGTASIIDGSKVNVGPSGLGYYKAKVKIYDSNYLQNSGWKVKKVPSTFFPDTWSKQRLQEELTLAFKNKKLISGNKYIGEMSDGVNIQFYVNGSLIDTAFPIF